MTAVILDRDENDEPIVIAYRSTPEEREAHRRARDEQREIGLRVLASLRTAGR